MIIMMVIQTLVAKVSPVLESWRKWHTLCVGTFKRFDHHGGFQKWGVAQ